jgi:hypothetical protein
VSTDLRLSRISGTLAPGAAVSLTVPLLAPWLTLSLKSMADETHSAEPTQLTQPKEGEPIEIPVPTEDDFEKLVRRAVNGKDSAASSADE